MTFQEKLFSFEAMERTLAHIASPNDCEKLRKYFDVTEEELTRLEAGDADRSKKLSEKEKTIKRMEFLLTVIKEKGHLYCNNIDTLIDAVSKFGDEIRTSSVIGPLEGYALHGSKSY